jgi:AcrR family transcriptional regulator
VVRQSERSQATRDALIRAGRELFAERGYDAVSVGEIATRAGVTTGALYHQFVGKAELFTAIYEQLVGAVWARVLTLREQSDEPSVIADCDAYLDACAEPEFFHITADGPAVIGWDRLVDGARAMIEASLTSARERGEIAARAQAGEASRQLIRGMLRA